jgi:hypothetical protein
MRSPRTSQRRCRTTGKVSGSSRPGRAELAGQKLFPRLRVFRSLLRTNLPRYPGAMEPTEGEQEQDRWRPSLPARAGAWAFVVVGLVTAALGSASAVLGSDRRGTAGPLFLAASGLLLAAVAWRWGLHPYLAATVPGIEIRNPLRWVLVPWSDVEGVVPGYSGIIVLRLSARSPGQHVTVASAGLAGTSRSPGQPATVTSVGLAGAHVKAWAVQKSNWAHWFGRRVRADDVAHDLAQRAQRERRARASLSPPVPPAGFGGRPAGTPR